MSGISSGIGLISGLPTADLIDQLIAIDRRPINTLEARIAAIEVQRTAFAELAAKLLSAQNAALSFGRSSFFSRFNSTSTDQAVLTASAAETASPGSFTFRVRSLVATHSVISRGVPDADTTPVGAGTLRIEVGNGRVNKSTELNALNGGKGVSRGVIRITDRGGQSAEIDLSTALTVDDVLDAINSNSAINVRASVTGLTSNGASGDRIVIEDLTDASLLDGTEKLIIADIGGSMAADLGLVASTTDGRVDGKGLVQLATTTALSILNDGNGVGRRRIGDDLLFSTTLGDFTVSLADGLSTQLDTDLRVLNGGNGVRLGVIRITDRAGQSAEVDLSSARTVQDILDAINAADVSVSATINGSAFQISDTSEVADQLAVALTVEDVSGFAAADLGLAQSIDNDEIDGAEVYRITTIGDVINAINFAPGNSAPFVEASLSANGYGITLRALGLNNTVTVSAGEGSTAAGDLGLLDATFTSDTPFHSRRLIAGLNTVLLRSLNGGRGVEAGTIKLTDRAGNTGTIDLSAAQTLQDVVDLINADTATGFVASINDAGHGIRLRDGSGGSNPTLIVEDLTGSLAADLGILVSRDRVEPFTGNVVNGTNAQLQYISAQTPLSQLNNGQGVRTGSFTVTDASGAVFTVTLGDNVKTIGDVLDRINAVRPDTLEARINDTGDGIVVIDTSSGTGTLTIEGGDGSRTAADLRLAGTAKDGETQIDGSFEIQIDIDANDTLADIARKINAAGAGLSASVLNHGGALDPVSLTITSGQSGRRGEMVIDSVGVDLGFSTLSRAQDALLAVGEDMTTNPRLISSSSNTLDGVVKGVTLNLLSTGDKPVTISVTQDVDGIVGAVRTFVNSYNDVLETIDRNTRFDPETFARGPLLGDATLNLVRTRLSRVALRQFEGVDESVSRLFSIGLRVGSGGRLSFDEDRFREVLQTSPELVAELFTKEDTGLGAVLKETFEELTRSFDGVLSRKDSLLADQQELLDERIDRLNVLLGARRARLESQFVGLEITLAALQQQQASLASLTGLFG